MIRRKTYPNAITNRLFYHKTPMAPPAVNTVFADPDLGASMVRVTDQSTDPNGGDDFFHNPSEDINQPYDGEVFCMETDLVQSTIWRFAHNRGIWDPNFYWTQPHGNLSLDGRFFSFTSSWDGQVGTTKGDGDPRSDIWMVKLD